MPRASRRRRYRARKAEEREQRREEAREWISETIYLRCPVCGRIGCDGEDDEDY